MDLRKITSEVSQRNGMDAATIIDNLPFLTWIKDREGRFVAVNEPFAHSCGSASTNDLIGKTDFDLWPKPLAEAYRADDLEIMKTGKQKVVEEFIGGSGLNKWFETYRAPLYDADRNIIGIIGLSKDITDRKQMEAELLRAHKLESLGVLAGGIAHDFNNLMAVVQGNIDLALMDLPSDHASRRRLLIAMQSVQNTRELTSHLITFSRGGGPHRELFDTAEIIRDVVHKTLKGTDVRAKFAFMEKLWPAEVDELQMRQCFCNLTTNALEAMPAGGNLTIHAENVRMPAGAVLDLKEGAYLKITFDDDGSGIPEKHLPSIFDPYFTTKKMAAQKGQGLGLATCYSVLKKHDGHISVKSQLGKGSSFVLYLPARADLNEKKGVAKTLSTAPPGC